MTRGAVEDEPASGGGRRTGADKYELAGGWSLIMMMGNGKEIVRVI